MFARLFDYSMSLGEEIAVIGDEDRLSFRRLHLLVEQLSVRFSADGHFGVARLSGCDFVIRSNIWQ